MIWSYAYTPYIWPMLVSAFSSGAITVYAWLHRRTPGGSAFAIQNLGNALWALFTALEIAATVIPTKFIYHKLEGVSAFMSISALLYFALARAGVGKRGLRRTAWLISSINIFLLILMVTNDLHHLIWIRLYFDQFTRVERGPLNMVMIAWVLLLPVAAMVLFAWMAIRSRGGYRWQALLLLAATLLPIFTYFPELAGINPIAPLDPVMLAWNVSCLLYAVAIFRFHMLSVAPVGRYTAIERMADGVLILDAEDQIVDLNPTAVAELKLSKRMAIGRKAEQVLAAYPDFLQLLDQKTPGGVEVTIQHNDQQRSYQAQASPLTQPGGFLLGRLILLRDVTTHKQAKAALNRSQAIQRLIFEKSFDGISIYEELPGEDKRILVDCNERYCQMADRSKAELLAIQDTRAIQRNENLQEEADRAAVMGEQRFSGVFSWIRPDGKENVIEYNAAPIRVGERFFTIGVDRDITERRRTQAQMLEQQRALAILREREQLARELHDGLGQALAAAHLQASTAKLLLAEGNAEQVGDCLEDLADATMQAEADMREYLLGVQVLLSPNRGFFAALRDYIARFNRQYGLPVELDVTPELEAQELAQTVALQLLRIIQEGLSNVRKHACAQHVQVGFAVVDGYLRVVVSDDGQGFDPAAQRPDRGFGLRSMRARAEGIGGRLEMISQPGQGTQVVVEAPLTAETETLAHVAKITWIADGKEAWGEGESMGVEDD